MSTTAKKFTYRPEGAKTKAAEIVLPVPSAVMTAGFMRRNRNESEMELGWRLLEAAAPDEKTLAKIDVMTMAEFEAFSEAWQSCEEEEPAAGES